MVVTLNPSLRLVIDNTDKNISSIETQTLSINQKANAVLDFPCQSDIEEVSLEKTEKILEEAYALFAIKYGNEKLNIDHYLLSDLGEDLNFPQWIIIDCIDIIYNDCDLDVNYEQSSTVEHYIDQEYKNSEYKNKILIYLEELFLKNNTSYNVYFPSLQEALSNQQVEWVKDTVNQIIKERIIWAKKIYSWKHLENKLSEISKWTQELYEIWYISLYILLDMETPYELIIDNNYMYSVIERMLDDQSVFIDLLDNIPE